MNKTDIQFVTNWIDNTILSEKVDTDHELHIDEINLSYKDKSLWISASLDILEYSTTYLKTHFETIRAIIIIPLIAYRRKKKGVNFTSLKDIESEFDYIPPYLNLFSQFDSNKPKFLNDRILFTKVKFHSIMVNVYYYEKYSEHSKQYIRNIILMGTSKNLL